MHTSTISTVVYTRACKCVWLVVHVPGRFVPASSKEGRWTGCETMLSTTARCMAGRAATISVQCASAVVGASDAPQQRPASVPGPAAAFPIKVIHGAGDILAHPKHAAKMAALLEAPFIMLEGAHFIPRCCAAQVRACCWFGALVLCARCGHTHCSHHGGHGQLLLASVRSG